MVIVSTYQNGILHTYFIKSCTNNILKKLLAISLAIIVIIIQILTERDYQVVKRYIMSIRQTSNDTENYIFILAHLNFCIFSASIFIYILKSGSQINLSSPLHFSIIFCANPLRRRGYILLMRRNEKQKLRKDLFSFLHSPFTKNSGH